MTKANQCENCQRSDVKQLFKLEHNAHIAFVCATCHHVLSMENQQERFKQMVRTKTYEQSNEDMQQVHKLLSGLIGTGVVLSAITFSMLIPGVSESILDIGALFLTTFK